jgi:probable HAF family extracellular repeat protein
MHSHLPRFANGAIAFFVAAVFLAGCASSSGNNPSPLTPTSVVPSIGTQHQQLKKGFVRYSIFNLGTLGGMVSGANGINNRGWTTGVSDLLGDQSEHAVLWRGRAITDLGNQLGGPSSAVAFDDNHANNGKIVGNAQTSKLDPYKEQWIFTCLNGNPCKGGDLISLGFRWQHGVMTALPTLGGTNGNATGINNRGQAVGFTETNIHDPNCVSPQVLDWEAVMWGPKKGETQELPPFQGDTVAVALAIDDKGEAVGGSGPICGTGPVPSLSVHAVLWRNGSAINLGSFGGTMNNVAVAINNQGQIVGFSDVAGDAAFHAFLWERGKMQDLGVLPGDASSAAQAINNKGQVLGNSCDQSGNCRVFLWQDGVMTDFNTLLQHNSSLYAINAGDINDRGEVNGWAFDQSNGETNAFLATPKQGDLRTMQVESIVPKITLPEHVRRMLLQRRGFGRF